MISFQNKTQQERISESLHAIWPHCQRTQLQKLCGDGGARAYWRVKLAGHRESSIIAAVLPDTEAAEVGGSSDKEAFLRIAQQLRLLGISVPEIFVFNVENSVYLQEDLGDFTLKTVIEKLDNGKIRHQLYLDSIDQMLKLEQLDKKTELPRFNKNLVHKEFEHFIEEIFVYKSIELTNTEISLLKAAFQEIINELLLLPLAPSFRDFQSRNIMVNDDYSDITIIDFQDAFYAPVGYDIVCLARDSSLPLSLSDSDCLESYWMHATTYTTNIHSLNLIGVQRNLKDAGRFSYFSRVGNKHAYLEWIPRTLFKACSALDQLESENAKSAANLIREKSPFGVPDSDQPPLFMEKK